MSTAPDPASHEAAAAPARTAWPAESAAVSAQPHAPRPRRRGSASPKVNAALALARELMDSQGLDGWTVRLDRARRRAGCCFHDRREITLSRVLVDVYPEDVVRGVILHEIAHAIVGPRHKHDAVWKREARRLGAPDSARLPASLPSPPARWVGTCPRCGATRELYSAPRRVVSCGSCSRVFSPDLVLQWRHDGVPAEPGGAYAKDLRRIRRRFR